MERFSYGLAVDGLKFAPISGDGGAGTVFTSVGKVLEDTIEFNAGSDSDTEFTAQGDSTASVVTTKKGIAEGRFSIMTIDPEVIADLTGGTTTGVGPNMLYKAPAGVQNIEKSIKIIDSQGVPWLIARAKIKASLVGRFRNGELNTVQVEFKVLQPTKVGEAAFVYGLPGD